jgi:Ca2+:H+ antiporter
MRRRAADVRTDSFGIAASAKRRVAPLQHSFPRTLSIAFKPSLHWLLVFVPVVFVLRFWPGLRNDTAIFVCACLAIIPLAGVMGRATEELAAHFGEGIGGLLNATFGNAAELIIALMALSKGLTGVVKASITGSIIGNILLVLGLSALCGGIKFREQTFNKTAARTSCVSLSLAAIALVIPTVFHVTADTHPEGWNPATEQKLSLAIAVVLLLTYACLLGFTLKTHARLFIGENHKARAANDGWSRTKAVVVLGIATILVAAISEFLVGTVEGARKSLGLTEVFVGVIVVAIIGNAAEHSTAVLAAIKNKMDLSLGVAIGSSLQIALFVAPLLVLVSYLFGRPMNLEFTLPEIVAVFVAVHLVFQISGDGESNWLEGVQLLSVYVILAILFFYLPETHHPAAF